MKAKLLLATGLAAGYVLGSRSGRAAYEKLKTQATGLWESKPVQDKVAAATEAVKEKAPEVSGQLTEAARRAGTVIGSAVRRDDATSGAPASTSAPSDEGTSADSAIPAHSSHPGTANLGTSGGVHTDLDATPDAEPNKN
ncbi:YtxH domain-containing protein [Arthrobacter sp. B3I4]|uniref:YtxH domain-containing protein n=1 Tax=Arthrobacter sp. B3I4 TaxID=3042267 RepID=UPI002783C9FC|nr:YtxH domain-containing protein [Arthrobacter sp. B3I4]MDQ0754559.1 hypothetical protein [Arthrobacter sp. B3I4]